MRDGVDREVLSYRWRGSPGFPVQGEVNGAESYSQVPGRVLGPERGERGEGLREPSGGWVGIRGAHATLRAALRLLYLQYETTGGRQASQESMEVGVEKKK